ncbi:hypothetical protein [Halorussus ruber]|uniref:hypothetical protein n=1 Tax=Halorussus ruber TaxID=1126238 RepID=UPI001091D6EF|nr:hypothetical protein [Halorussus ruber]
MTRQRIGGAVVTAVGIALTVRGDASGVFPLGLLFAVVGLLTLADSVADRRVTSLRTALGVVAAWLLLAVVLRVRALSAARPELGMLDAQVWEVVLLDPWFLAAFVGALVLPFALGGRLVRAAVGLVALGLFSLTLVRYGGGGGFGVRFNLLLYLGTYAAGAVAGLVAYAPLLMADSGGALRAGRRPSRK